ncbi:MAG: fluoride efflux transporter CrcB [Bacteroidia bacterium]|nr:fluoride efflux transporter CrcB [Bacteroidia bacterium]
MKSILLVGIGGFFGSVARYYISFLITKNHASLFPLGTYAVNIIGCLLIGLIYGFTESIPYSSQFRLLLATGFCGGFTTFSAFASENLSLIQKGEYTLAVFYIISSVLLGIMAVLGGILLVKILK